ncbi:MAG: ATP-dependent helicase, partial [Verrucomicrobiales bacterium]
MNPDRATLSFLNALPEKAREEGKRMHDAGCVTQIFGNHLFIQARVENDSVHRTYLKLQGNEWLGECSAEEPETADACLYATMLERLERGEHLPESPNEVGEQALTEILEESLGRELSNEEDTYVAKVEKRYRRYEMSQELYDHDLVRLYPKWDIVSYDPLKLWPVPPVDIVEFWNYIAYAFKKRNHLYPPFMEAITDLDATEGKMAAWEWEREVLSWRQDGGRHNGRPIPEEEEGSEVRLVLTTNEGRLQFRMAGEQEFTILNQKADLNRFMARRDDGGLLLDGPSEVLWEALVQNWNVTDDLRFRLDSQDTCRVLHRLFRQQEMREHLVTLDAHPFVCVDQPLRWIC